MRHLKHPRRLLSGVILSALLLGCHTAKEDVEQPTTPAPLAQRPVLKTEAELAAERQARITAGQQVPTSAPVLIGMERVARERRADPAPPPFAGPGAIEADVLMVDDKMITVPEVLFLVREEIEDLRKTQTALGFRERVTALVRSETQRMVGSLLIFKEATANLTDEQKKIVEQAREKDYENYKARRADGSDAKMKAFLSREGLTVDQFKSGLERDMIVRQYTRERLLSQVQVRRDELLAHYRRNLARYQTPETREFQLIEFPFTDFLPEGQTWASANNAARAQAKLAAVRRAREAHEALAQKPFEEVARTFGRGPRAEQGGSWGMIGKPLQAPYDKLSALIFDLADGAYTEPVETPDGWYIVRCGGIDPAQQQPFLEVQDEIRKELTDQRFEQISRAYVMRLAEKATVSSIDAFVRAAVASAERTPVALDSSDQ